MGGDTSAKGIRRRKLFAGGQDPSTSGTDPVDDLKAGPGVSAYNWASDPTAVNAGVPAPATTGAATRGTTLQDILGKGSRIATDIAPYMSNITNAFRTPPHPAQPQLVNPVTLSRINLSATRQQAAAASRAQDLNADRSLDEQSAAAVRSSNLAKNLNQQGQISEQEAFLNARQKAEAAGMNLNVDAINTSAMNKTKDEEVARTIALQREQSQNISNASDKFIGIGNERAKAQLDMQKLSALKQVWQQSGVYDRMLKRMKDQGIKDPTGVMGQMSWLGDAMENADGVPKAMGGALTSPLVGKKKQHAALLSEPMMGPGKNGIKQVFATGGPGPVGQFTPGNIARAQASGVQTANLADDLAGTITTGNMPKTGVAPENQHLFTDANVYFQSNPHMTPEQRLNGYYGRPVDPNNPTDMMRGKLASVNRGPVANYWASPNQDLQMRQGTKPGAIVQDVATGPMPHAFGGFKSTVARGYINPFGNTRSIGLGPGIPKDKFNPMHISHQQHNLLAMGGAPKSDGASDVNATMTNYGDATPDLYENGGHRGNMWSEEYRRGGSISNPRLVDHSMWKEPYKENALNNNDPMFADGGDLGPGNPVSTTAVAHPPLPKQFLRTNGMPVKTSYEFLPAGASAADSSQYRQGFMNSLQRMHSKALAPMTEPALYWGDFNSGKTNVRNPGVDVPGMSNAFNSGGREAYMNMPAGSFSLHAMGGEYSGETTARDMSMWNQKVWGSRVLASGGTTETPGDGHKERKPIPVSNPSDPRLKSYNDSLRLYSLTHPNGEDGAINKSFDDKTMELKKFSPYDRESFVRYKGYNMEPSSDQISSGNKNVYFPVYSKPVQPYTYQRPIPEPKRVQVQSVGSSNQSVPGIKASPPSSDVVVSQTPTKFSFTGRNDRGEQVSTYFPDLKSWRDFTDNVPWSHKETAGNNAEAHATGVGSQFAGGGWISKAVNPKHKGYCTPMTKSTCTPRRKAFAMTMKKHHGFHAAGGNLKSVY